jgi:hypothetical protein
MCTVLSESFPIARKNYPCDAAEWLINAEDLFGRLTFTERRKIINAKKNKWMIRAGEKYMKQVAIVCGEFCMVRCNLDIHAICKRLDLYQNDDFC